MTTDELLNRAIWTFAAAFGLWLMKECVEGWRRSRLAKKQQNNLVRALYSEIDFNTRDMEEFLASRQMRKSCVMQCQLIRNWCHISRMPVTPKFIGTG